MSVEKRSISAERDLFTAADARAARLRYKKFSHYVQALIEADVEYQDGKSDFMHERPLPAVAHPAKPPVKITRYPAALKKDTSDKIMEIVKQRPRGAGVNPPKP